MVEEEKPNRSYEAFLELSRYKKTLAITRIRPRQIKERFNISGEIFWLSTMKANNTINPTDLDKFISIIFRFLRKNKGGAILLDGTEYLILQNGFDTALKFICSVRDHVSLYDAILLLPVSPETLKKSQIKMLERELELLQEKSPILRFIS